jgi:hypothetical protein
MHIRRLLITAPKRRADSIISYTYTLTKSSNTVQSALRKTADPVHRAAHHETCRGSNRLHVYRIRGVSLAELRVEEMGVHLS